MLDGFNYFSSIVILINLSPGGVSVPGCPSAGVNCPNTSIPLSTCPKIVYCSVILRGRCIGDKELTATGVRARVDHCDHSWFVERQCWIKLGNDVITRMAFACPARIACLRKSLGMTRWNVMWSYQPSRTRNINELTVIGALSAKS